MSAYLLGIDVGTSTVKVILVEEDGGKVSQEAFLSLPRKHAHVPDITGAQERKVEDILNCLEEVMGGLDASKLQCVCAVGVCGQMHGCVLWNEELAHLKPIITGSCSNLITWQDARCSPGFLSSLPATRQPAAVLSAGYGCATLAWLQRHQLTVLKRFTRAGTIMDLVVWLLCLSGRDQPVLMSAQNARSWGYFDEKKMQWETDLLTEALFPVRLLPEVVPAPSLAGLLHSSWHGVPEGTPVCVGMGDLQCSFMAAKPTASDAVLNIGSASQLGVVKPAHGTHSCAPPLPPSIMEVPYFHTDSLLVAASLTGANVLSTLVEALRGWMQELEVHTESISSDTKLYERLVSLAMDKLDTSLSVQVTLWGERHNTSLAGAVGNVTPGNLSIGDISSAMFRGIVENLQTLMPDEIFQSLQIERLLGSGSALQRNPALQHHVRTVFKRPLELREQADAPLGAALAAGELTKTQPKLVA